MSLAIAVPLSTTDDNGRIKFVKSLVRFHHVPRSSRPPALRDVEDGVLSRVKLFKDANAPIAIWLDPGRYAQACIMTLTITHSADLTVLFRMV